MQTRSEVLRKVANRETDRQTDKQRRLHILLDGGYNSPSTLFFSSIDYILADKCFILIAIAELAQKSLNIAGNGAVRFCYGNKKLSPA